VIAKIKIACKKSLADEVAVRKTQAEEYAKQLKEVQDNLNIVEEKWLKNEIAQDTYRRWYGTYSENILNLKASIARLNRSQNEPFALLEKNLSSLSTLDTIYNRANTLQKRQFKIWCSTAHYTMKMVSIEPPHCCLFLMLMY